MKRVDAGAAADSPGRPEQFPNLPLSFEANCGQADPSVKFLSRKQGCSIFLAPTEVVIVADSPSTSSPGRDCVADGKPSMDPSDTPRSATLRMKLIGADVAAPVTGLDELPGRANYLIGNDPKNWHSGISTYGKVKCDNVYPGIDIIYHSNHGRLEYDFNLAPGADPGAIRLSLEGSRNPTIDSRGDLVLETAAGEIRHHKPASYQDENGMSVQIESHYVIDGDGQIRIEVGDYDASKSLVIDPVLGYATYLGGSADDRTADITVDRDGNVYLAGTTRSANFPVASAIQPNHSVNVYGDVFISKVNPAGTALVYSTYLGGDNEDKPVKVAVDSSGNLYLIGSSGSSDFPVTPGALQSNKDRLFSQFVAKVSPAGDALVYSTYLPATDAVLDIKVDPGGNAYLTGATFSTDFPTTQGAFQGSRNGDDTDAFVAKLNRSGSAFVYSTYLGGSDFDSGASLSVDGAGNAYVTGYTLSRDFPTTQGAFAQTSPSKSRNLPRIDAFVTKVNADGSALVYSTFLGGQDRDQATAIAVDSNGSAYVTGDTRSLDFPTTAAAIQTDFNGGFIRSNDGGLGWKNSNGGLSTSDLFALAVDPRNSAILYAVTARGIVTSTDGGRHWEPPIRIDFSPTILAIDPRNTSVLYAGTRFTGVFKSTNGGRTWAAAGTLAPLFFLNILIIDRANPSTIYAAGVSPVPLREQMNTENGSAQPAAIPPPIREVLLKTTDGGSTWLEPPSTGLPRDSIQAMIDDPMTGSLYVSAGGAIYRSTDGAATWASMNLTAASALTIAVDPRTPTTLYVGTSPGSVYKTTDGGTSWTSRGQGIPDSILVRSLLIDPETPSSVYAGTNDGVYKSTDGGANWSATLISGDIGNLALDLNDPSNVYATVTDSSDVFVTKLSPTGGSVLYSTLLGGRQWDSPFGIAVSPAGNAYVVGFTFSGNFPARAAIQAIKGAAAYTAFVAKLNDSGDAFVYSTYLGGEQRGRNSTSQASAIALGPSGVAYVAGEGAAPGFPTVNALQPAFAGGLSDCFLVKLVEPRIISVSRAGKDLVVRGENFSPNAQVLINGSPKQTAADSASPTTTLIAGKAGKKLKQGKSVSIQVRNANEETSEPFNFTPAEALRELRVSLSVKRRN